MELAEQMQSDLDVYVMKITKNNRLSNGSLPSGLQDNIKKHNRQKAS